MANISTDIGRVPATEDVLQDATRYNREIIQKSFTWNSERLFQTSSLAYIFHYFHNNDDETKGQIALVGLPTGAGKTRIMYLAACHERTLILTPNCDIEYHCIIG